MASRGAILPAAVVGGVGVAAVIWVLAAKRDQVAGAGEFSGERALAHVAELVGVGPRIPGGEAIERARVYIGAQLAASGWSVLRQTFVDDTPRGQVEFVNLRARYAPGGGEIDWKEGGGLVLLCSHYDTKLIEGVEFDGANDGGSSTGVLIEMARCLATAPALAGGVELVFFDGEEAVVDFTATDGLYGSRHYAKGWRSAPPASKPVAAFVLDLVGDSRLRIDPPNDSPRDLLVELYGAAEQLGVRRRFGMYPAPITDDHVPLNAAGIPALNVIDSGYISRGRWHTSADRLEYVSADGLELVGRVMLRLLERRAGR